MKNLVKYLRRSFLLNAVIIKEHLVIAFSIKIDFAHNSLQWITRLDKPLMSILKA